LGTDLHATFDRIGNLDHIGIAVTSLKDALAVYQKSLGFHLHEIEEVPTEKVKVAILTSSETRVELLEPTSSASPVAKFLESRGGGVHHLAFAVREIEAEVERLRNEGVKLIEPAPRPGAQGSKVAFIHPKSTGGVLIELVQRV
jgi:methylmalonyl-CoA/ethylmalonyl-CoA epimerase